MLCNVQHLLQSCSPQRRLALQAEEGPLQLRYFNYTDGAPVSIADWFHDLPSLPQWVNDLNTILSFVGIGVTLWVSRQVASIRRAYLARAQLPDLHKEMEEITRRMAKHLEAKPFVPQEFLGEMKVALETVTAAGRIVDRTDRATLNLVLRSLQLAVKGLPSWDSAWIHYTDVQRVTRSVGLIAQTLKWK